MNKQEKNYERGNGEREEEKRKEVPMQRGGNTVCGASRPHLGSPGVGSHWHYWCGP